MGEMVDIDLMAVALRCGSSSCVSTIFIPKWNYYRTVRPYSASDTPIRKKISNFLFLFVSTFADIHTVAFFY
jgi:hypothetical protein